MENNKIKVSVIMPVYNGSKYLRECLDSIIYQTLKEIEIICINDGSKDNSLEILQKYADKDDRIVVIDQENQGQGVARKNGLSIAKGEYLSFLDQDDFFDLQLFEKSYNKAISTGADVTIYQSNTFDDSKKEFSKYVSGKKNGIDNEKLPDKDVFSCDDMLEDIFYTFGHELWSKLFKTSFIRANNINFVDRNYGEDKFFLCSALALAEKITVLDEVLVFYRIGIKSASGNLGKISLDFYHSEIALIQKLKEQNVYEKLELGFLKSIISSSIHNLNVQKSYNAFKTVYEHLAQNFEKDFSILKYENYFYAQPEHIFNLYEKMKLIFSISVDEYLEINKQYFIDQTDTSLKISVIIPVYNVEKYLRDCLDSVINQTLTDIEIICVNDGSTDNCGDILREYADKDSRIIILNHINKGLSATRNKGIEIAKGKFIYFLDSDDMIAPYALEKMFTEVTINNLDILFFDAKIIFENDLLELTRDTIKNHFKKRNLTNSVISGAKMLALMQQNKSYNVQSCLYLTNSSFLKQEGILFKEGILYEDNLFLFKLILSANRVKHIEHQLFIYRVRDNSITNQIVKFNHFYGYFITFIEMVNYANNFEYSDDVEEAVVITLNNIRYSVLKYYNLLSNDDEKNKVITLTKLEKYYFDTFFAPKLEIKTNINDVGGLTDRLNWNRNELRKSKKIINKYEETRGLINKYLGQIDYYKTKYEETRGLMNKYKGQVSYHQKDKENLKNSLSYKLGRIITWLPRKLK